METTEIYVAVLKGQVNTAKFNEGDELRYDPEQEGYIGDFTDMVIPKEVMIEIVKSTKAFVPKNEYGKHKKNKANTDKLNFVMSIILGERFDLDDTLDDPKKLLKTLYKVKQKLEEIKERGEEGYMANMTMNVAAGFLETAKKYMAHMGIDFDELEEKPKPSKNAETLNKNMAAEESNFTATTLLSEIAWVSQRMKLLKQAIESNAYSADMKAMAAEYRRHDKWLNEQKEAGISFDHLIYEADKS